MRLNVVTKKIWNVTLLCLFIGYYSGITLFYHVHYFNGQYYIHSHFYTNTGKNNAPLKSHSHPLVAYASFSQLGHIVGEELDIKNPYQKPEIRLECILQQAQLTDKLYCNSHLFPGRAPPGFI